MELRGRALEVGSQSAELAEARGRQVAELRDRILALEGWGAERAEIGSRRANVEVESRCRRLEVGEPS